MIKLIRYIYQKFQTSSKIKFLDIVQVGCDNDEDAFIKLSNGLIFFGPKSAPKEKKFYSLFLSSRLKQKLPFECYQVAIDIVVRFKEGNLKWGGPAKEAFYKVKNGDYIAEMGAFRGYYTLYLAQKVGEKGKIIAIEPIPENLYYLKKNIAINKLGNVFIVPKGVWNANEEKEFQRKASDYQSGSIDIAYNDSDSQKIEVNTLDTILEESKVSGIDFMLIQLNGAEYEALEGLTKLKPKNFSIAARYDKAGRNISQEIEHLLKERGYETHVLNHKFVYAGSIK